jgi:hypothetical protein
MLFTINNSITLGIGYVTGGCGAEFDDPVKFGTTISGCRPIALFKASANLEWTTFDDPARSGITVSVKYCFSNSLNNRTCSG